MTKHLGILLMLIISGLLWQGCQEDNEGIAEDKFVVSPQVIDQIIDMGFNPEGIKAIDEGYLIERDIIIRHSDLGKNIGIIANDKDNKKQFSTDNLVQTNGSRVISMYISAPGCEGSGNSTSGNGSSNGNGQGNSSISTTTINEMGNGNGNGNGGGNGGNGGGGTQFDQDYADAMDDAMARFNAENLEITFVRVCDPAQADITFNRLKKGEERQGILGSAGFPTSSGDPYDEINMSGIIISRFGWSVDALATVMAHEMGHCIGFRHTDYYDRSISCGGSPTNEGSAGIGANHIPGTPNVGEVDFADQSWMLSCTGNVDRQFNAADQVALDFLY